ncbi:uncharacterized protein GLRG_04459 [Colletotrichum graminicola M1.001]|uniref:Uncharacterized protein n=1 Tax=Colletotrichum graminicola (strain M1.001 / M2 / FGSC 10212) TaxID=645133 RepID=E3QEK9_COLGM|nr:uncharacterized protein GLRG_04459 [Colletotrichum graminicola M1.001]EFQ29315.1 hypothetical protein GLRG_04459 [Colletotrichum graminicola M1.001]
MQPFRREHYAQKKGNMFDGLAGKREPLVIIDFGTAPDSGNDSDETRRHKPASSWKRKGKLYLVRDGVSEDGLLDILTYHQVPVHFLGFPIKNAYRLALALLQSSVSM